MQISRKCPEYDKEAIFQNLREAAMQDSLCGQYEVIERKAKLSPKNDTTVYAIVTNIATYDKVEDVKIKSERLMMMSSTSSETDNKPLRFLLKRKSRLTGNIPETTNKQLKLVQPKSKL